MPNITTSKDGTRIAFERSGTGPALILVDGAMCRRAFGPMAKIAPFFEPNFTVFRYDRRGRGDSGDTQPYAIEREIEDLAALIREAGGSASLLGLSSGAALALEAAASGLPIEKLALYEPPYTGPADGAAANHEAHLKQLIAAKRRSDAVEYFMKDMVNVPAVFVLLMRVMFPMWSKLKAVAHTLPYDAAILRGFRLPQERAAAIRVPTLAMAGDKTQPRLLDAIRLVAQTIPGAKLELLKGQTHVVDGKVLAPVVTAFLLDGGATLGARPRDIPARPGRAPGEAFPASGIRE